MVKLFDYWEGDLINDLHQNIINPNLNILNPKAIPTKPRDPKLFSFD